jgi:hypothetical protein
MAKIDINGDTRSCDMAVVTAWRQPTRVVLSELSGVLPVASAGPTEVLRAVAQTARVQSSTLFQLPRCCRARCFCLADLALRRHRTGIQMTFPASPRLKLR